MLMSFDTSTTSRSGCCSRSALTTPRIWLSALPCGRPAGRRDVDQVGLEEQLAAGLAVAGAVEGDALAPARGVARRHVGGERVEVAAHLAGVARHLGHAALVPVELLERDHRQVDVVLLEAEQRRRVVHQHVGVEHEQRRAGRCPGPPSSPRSGRSAWWPARGRRRRLGDGAGRARGGGGAAGSARLRSAARAAAGATGSAAGRPRRAPLRGAAAPWRFELFAAEQVGALGGRLGQGHGGLEV